MRLLIIGMLMLALTLASCGTDSGLDTLYAGGTNGLVMAFEKDAPPPLIYDNRGTPMTVILNARNDGEFDTENVRVSLKGISTNDFDGLVPEQGPGEHQVSGIDGKALIQESVIEGETGFFELGELTYKRELRGGGELDFTLHADVCYGYATLATAQICLSDDYLAPGRGCDAATSDLQVSGAPVTISNLVTSAVGADILRFSFDVSRAANVDIWGPVAGQTCDPATRTERTQQAGWVYVRVDDGFDSVNAVTCSNLLERQWAPDTVLSYDQMHRERISDTITVEPEAEGYVRIADGPAKVTCTLRVPPGNEGMSTIDVALAYYVGDRISHPFSVVHADI